MLRLVTRPLSSDWSKFVYALFDDMEPLGHRVERLEDGILALELTEPKEHDDWQKIDPNYPDKNRSICEAIKRRSRFRLKQIAFVFVSDDRARRQSQDFVHIPVISRVGARIKNNKKWIRDRSIGHELAPHIKGATTSFFRVAVSPLPVQIL
jgi:hypothetical protein